MQKLSVYRKFHHQEIRWGKACILRGEIFHGTLWILRMLIDVDLLRKQAMRNFFVIAITLRFSYSILVLIKKVYIETPSWIVLGSNKFSQEFVNSYYLNNLNKSNSNIF